jgi:energy-converting hydrogenase Eha subunit G
MLIDGKLYDHVFWSKLTVRTNWSGAAMATFYTAVRQALVVAIIFRGLATVSGIAGLAWCMWKFGSSAREL